MPAGLRDEFRALAAADGDGWCVPALSGLLEIWKIDDPIDRAWVGSKISPFPLRCFEQPARLAAGAADRLPRTYLASTGYPAAHTVFAPFASGLAGSDGAITSSTPATTPW